MPIYEYACSNCGQHFDKMQSITADPLTECINCGSGPIRRVLHPVGVIFKGSGWYINDSRKSSNKSDSSSSSDGGSSSKTSDVPKSKEGDAPKTETPKTETPKTESSSSSSD